MGFIPECILSGDESWYEQDIPIVGEILEEIFANIMKHGQPYTKVYVLVRCGKTHLRIYSANQISTLNLGLFPPSGRGLSSMKRKIERLGGDLDRKQDAGEYSISISLPVKASGEPDIDAIK